MKTGVIAAKNTALPTEEYNLNYIKYLIFLLGCFYWGRHSAFWDCLIHKGCMLFCLKIAKMR